MQYKRTYNLVGQIQENLLRVNIKTIVLCFLIILQSACKKLVEVESPITNTNAEIVYNNDALAASVLTGIYANMSNSSIIIGGINSTSLFLGLSADEITLFNAPSQSNKVFLPYYYNSLNSVNTGVVDFWTRIYPIIYTTNVALEGLNNSVGLSSSVKRQLLGEAHFIRAFSYFYLVNLYSDVPLILTSDWKVSASMPRTSKNQVYQQIISDLKEAKEFLSEKYVKGDASTAYLSGAEERVRPNKWAAVALLARVYLYIGDWINAENEATLVINNSSLFGLTGLNDVFKKNSKEAIWQLQPVGINTNSNTPEGRLFVLPAAGPNTNNYPVYLSNSLINSFEVNDLRKLNWVDSVKPTGVAYYYAKKYKIGIVNTSTQEYSTILRLAEIYLIRAEARAQQGKISESQNDLNAIRIRAGLAPTSATDKPSLMTAILKERRIELFTELGHRWLDLKRSGNIDIVMSIITPNKSNGLPWQTTQQLFPITLSELQKDPNLVQNPGY